MRTIIYDETLEITRRAHQLLPSRGVHVTFAGSRQELALAFAAGEPPALLIVNLDGDLTSWELAEELRRARYEGRTLVLVDRVDAPGVSFLTQLPRAECLVHPSSPAALEDLLKRVVSETAEALPRAVPQGAPPLPTFHGMVGRSKAMQDIFCRIKKVALGDANVCIYGESGTGKELIARAIHYNSSRRDRPLITLDCAAVPEGLMESHLFGHVKGAFTSAVDHREGVFSLAHTGTLFIDELCELSLPLQAKLLRVVQSREFLKVGGTKPIHTDVRLIMATNQDPKRAVERGTFREDLYYRVAVVMIKVPPLRERKDDVPLLVEHFLRKFSAVYSKRIRSVTPSVMDRMMALLWPGNVRQLENFLEQAVVLAEGEILNEEDLHVEESSVWASEPSGPIQFGPGLPLREVERRYILQTLHQVQGNRTRAAKLLGVSLRCLQYKLKSYAHGGNGEMPLTSSGNENDLEMNSRLTWGIPK